LEPAEVAIPLAHSSDTVEAFLSLSQHTFATKVLTLEYKS